MFSFIGIPRRLERLSKPVSPVGHFVFRKLLAILQPADENHLFLEVFSRLDDRHMGWMQWLRVSRVSSLPHCVEAYSMTLQLLS